MNNHWGNSRSRSRDSSANSHEDTDQRVGRHPPHLHGREIGLWYARHRSDPNRKSMHKELKTLGSVKIAPQHVQKIKALLHGLPPITPNSHPRNNENNPNSQFNREYLNLINSDLDQNLQNMTTIQLISTLDTQLHQEFVAIQDTSYYQKMQTVRKRLPAYSMREEIVTIVNNNQIVIISGGTGCGKSTQVPQYILDDYLTNNRGSLCKIVCSQPRRISAISLAERIADERGEELPGRSVGYQIRLENKLPRARGSILFCTTGVILKQMESNVGFNGISHLILDEIHERDMMSDFILAVIKQVIKKSTIKLIVMSATMNIDKFIEYFDAATAINIPGYTHDVKEYYLEDVLLRTQYRFPDDPPKSFRRSKESSIQFQALLNPYVKGLRDQNLYTEAVRRELLKKSSEECIIDLAVQLIANIMKTEEDNGSILVFLTGSGDIYKMNEQMEESGQFPRDKCLIIPLHSQMPTSHQRTIFNPPPHGMRKIILSTNIAETSITIEDVVYVIDCGKIKINDFNSEVKEDTLQPQWVSKANADQRRGRAGRLRPGVCFHLFSRFRNDKLESFQKPELLRNRLDSVILNVKLLQLGGAEEFLSTCLDPPLKDNIQMSINFLQQLGAIDEKEILTPLGLHLAKLPVAPQMGKMMLLGALFSCVDPILDIASALDYKDPFFVPLTKETETRKRKKQLAGGFQSDHILFHLVMKKYQHTNDKGKFCWDQFLSKQTMYQLSKMKNQFGDILRDLNFLDGDKHNSQDANINSNNFTLIKSIICASLYPNVFIGNSRISQRKSFTKFFTMDRKRVELHPKSTLTPNEYYDSPIFVFYRKVRSTSDFVHDASMIYPIQLIFFAEKIKVDANSDRCIITINDRLQFTSNSESISIIMELRDRMNHFLLCKASHPAMVNWLNENEVKVLRAIMMLVTMDTLDCES